RPDVSVRDRAVRSGCAAGRVAGIRRGRQPGDRKLGGGGLGLRVGLRGRGGRFADVAALSPAQAYEKLLTEPPSSAPSTSRNRPPHLPSLRTAAAPHRAGLRVLWIRQSSGEIRRDRPQT